MASYNAAEGQSRLFPSRETRAGHAAMGHIVEIISQIDEKRNSEGDYVIDVFHPIRDRAVRAIVGDFFVGHWKNYLHAPGEENHFDLARVCLFPDKLNSAEQLSRYKQGSLDERRALVDYRAVGGSTWRFLGF
jgi:hypothetical protein